MYKIGQKFRLVEDRDSTNEIYLLCGLEDKRKILIEISTGVRWSDSVQTESWSMIDEEDFEKLVDNTEGFTFELCTDC